MTSKELTIKEPTKIITGLIVRRTGKQLCTDGRYFCNTSNDKDFLDIVSTFSNYPLSGFSLNHLNLNRAEIKLTYVNTYGKKVTYKEVKETLDYGAEYVVTASGDIEWARVSLQVGDKYYHYKGGVYEIVGIAREATNSKESLSDSYKVVYRGLKGEKKLWIRSMNEFFSLVPVTTNYYTRRFTKISEDGGNPYNI